MLAIWTPSQLDAIEARRGSILVSAAAGSGKTSVLVERVIRSLLDEKNPISADRLLIVTFTKAAAQSMKQKIKVALDEKLEQTQGNKLIRRQRALLNQAQISTIHSFCQGLVKENFQALDISQNFSLEDASKLSVLKREALEAVLEKKLDQKKEIFYELLDVFSSNKSIESFFLTILNVYEFLCCQPYPMKWKEKSKLFYSIDTSAWKKLAILHTKKTLDFCFKIIETQQYIFDTIKIENETIKRQFIELLSSDLQAISELNQLLDDNWDAFMNAIHSFNLQKMPSVSRKDEVLQIVKNNLSDKRRLIKKEINDLKKIFFKSWKENQEDLSEMHPVVVELFDCVEEFEQEYNMRKAESKIADFNDLERWTLKLLIDDNGEKTSLSAKISNSYDAIMVDEYQDVNDVQELIFSIISQDGKNLFTVGDVKQSIYNFRQARPQIFLDKKNKYPLYSGNLDNYPAKIILDANFRSSIGVTEAVNFIFENLMSQDVGEIEYDKEEHLIFGADIPINAETDVEFHVSECEKGCDKAKIEATYIAFLIMHHLENTEIYEKGSYRKANCGDFAILMRSPKKNAIKYVETLKEYQIYAASNSEEGFFDTREIRLMLNFLRVINNPTDDIPLLSVMFSVLYNFSANELAKIRISQRNGNFYSACISYLENDDGLSRKLKSFFDDMREYRNIAAGLPLFQLINIIYQKSHILTLSAAIFKNISAENNLNLLHEYAKKFESSEPLGLSAFLNHIKKITESGEDLKSASDDSNSENCVKIMSIHKSKGLEFPICIIADTFHKFSTDTINPALTHKDLGFAFKRKHKSNFRVPTLPHEIVKRKLQSEEKSEELRNLYVAMTRAKQKLIMLCTYAPSGNSNKGLHEFLGDFASKLIIDDNKKLSKYSAMRVTSPAQWLLMCALIHPSGSELRRIVGGDFPVIADSNLKPWKIIINTKSKIEALNVDNFKENIEKNVEKKFSTEFESKILDKEIIEMSEKLAQRIKAVRCLNEQDIPWKVTASELTHSAFQQNNFEKLAQPEFLEKQKISGIDRGVAMHTFLQHCDFSVLPSGVEDEIYRLVKEQILEEWQAEAIEREKVKIFCESDIFKSLKESPIILREHKFLVEIPAETALPNLRKFDENEKILLQGAVDLAFVQDGKLIIVDYKTDRMMNPEAFFERYGFQLQLYKKAMEQCTDYKVKKCVIYATHLGRSIDIY